MQRSENAKENVDDEATSGISAATDIKVVCKYYRVFEVLRGLGILNIV